MPPVAQKPSCKKEYSQKDEAELARHYEAYRKKKRAEKYQKNKIQKTSKENATIKAVDPAIPSTSKNQDVIVESENSDIFQPSKIKGPIINFFNGRSPSRHK